MTRRAVLTSTTKPAMLKFQAGRKAALGTLGRITRYSEKAGSDIHAEAWTIPEKPPTRW